MVKESQIKIMKEGLATKGPIEMDKDMLKEVEEQLKDNPYDFLAHCARGVLYFNYDFEKAIESFSDALAINPFDSNQYYNRGRKFLSLDKYSQALSDLTVAVRIDDKDSWKWHFLGVAYFGLNRFKDAIDCFFKSIDLHFINKTNNIPPEVEWIWLSYVQLGEFDKANEALKLVDEDTPVQGGDISYKRRILLKRNIISACEFESSINYESDSHAATELYGLANYYQHIEKNQKRVIEILEKILSIKTSHHAFAYKMAKHDYSLLVSLD
ncbi:tetratricopeptide repeat protein [Sedimentibacter hydroxybenzoicus DSM 7310]|uniref:Tetratricopeptide repeat protein n=1 Tax=Sedimentibacter hydroxybenzoicus DSM 7310 TaxID=1123245 RepID=A0A974BLQ7_SEDHY|nr:tetratricopeptide repeat protein [Sedimentibacter hydroxybenzoicus]NYB75283.1 tetratricopeptide repeat protein [Sedimentibacter hydroxybenzoicus DSM 7310]